MIDSSDTLNTVSKIPHIAASPKAQDAALSVHLQEARQAARVLFDASESVTEKMPELTIDDLLFLESYGDHDRGLGLRHVGSKDAYDHEIAHGRDRGDALALASIRSLIGRDLKGYVNDKKLLSTLETYHIEPGLHRIVELMNESQKSRLLQEYKQAILAFAKTCLFFSDPSSHAGETVREFMKKKNASHYFTFLLKRGAKSPSGRYPIYWTRNFTRCTMNHITPVQYGSTLQNPC